MGSQQARGLAEADRLIHSCGHTHMLKNGKSKSESDSSLWVQPPTAPKLLHFCNTYGTAHQCSSHILASTPCGNPLSGLSRMQKPIVRAIHAFLLSFLLLCGNPLSGNTSFCAFLLPRILAKTPCENPSGLLRMRKPIVRANHALLSGLRTSI